MLVPLPRRALIGVRSYRGRVMLARLAPTCRDCHFALDGEAADRLMWASWARSRSLLPLSFTSLSIRLGAGAWDMGYAGGEVFALEDGSPGKRSGCGVGVFVLRDALPCTKGAEVSSSSTLTGLGTRDSTSTMGWVSVLVAPGALRDPAERWKCTCTGVRGVGWRYTNLPPLYTHDQASRRIRTLYGAPGRGGDIRPPRNARGLEVRRPLEGICGTPGADVVSITSRCALRPARRDYARDPRLAAVRSTAAGLPPVPLAPVCLPARVGAGLLPERPLSLSLAPATLRFIPA
ncbi:hypothetical protein FB451DRAFT_1414518 [Mycena latifolia]|nr:hypothetical protein FB451DRAFT_1414518 [Mycena latifolia]